jgi:HSP20 family molecular chaperone IbpA
MSEHTLEMNKQEIDGTNEIERTTSTRTFVPRVDIYEIEDRVVLLADMPGVDENSVDITLEKNILTIRGDVHMESSDNYQLSYREYQIGNYERTFALSDEVDREGIEATVKHGVLQVLLPKAEEVRTKKIAVKATS